MRKEDMRPENFSPYWEIPFEELYPEGDIAYFETPAYEATQERLPSQTEKLIGKIQKHMEIIHGKRTDNRQLPSA